MTKNITELELLRAENGRLHRELSAHIREARDADKDIASLKVERADPRKAVWAVFSTALGDTEKLNTNIAKLRGLL